MKNRIIVLLLLQGYGKGGNLILDIASQLLYLPFLIILVYLFERFILFKLIVRFEQIHEYIFLLAIAWCLGVAEFANLIGLEVHAGHGLTYKSAKIISKVNGIKEFNIGHFIISQSIFIGIKKTIINFKKILN